MSNRIIAIDCDDVIVNTAPAIIRHYNEHYGVNVDLKDLYSNDLSVWAVDDIQTANDRAEQYLHSDEYQLATPPSATIEVINELGKRHELHIVTGRSDFLTETTQNMLDRYFPGIFRSIEFTNFFGSQQRSKAQVCKSLGADLLIDDHLHHVTVVAQSGVEAYLFGNYPWNQADQLPTNITRVRDWHEVATKLLP